MCVRTYAAKASVTPRSKRLRALSYRSTLPEAFTRAHRGSDAAWDYILRDVVAENG